MTGWVLSDLYLNALRTSASGVGAGDIILLLALEKARLSARDHILRVKKWKV